MNNKKTDIWKLYEGGKEYKQSIGLFDETDKNERFFIGDQWESKKIDGLPKPVFNILKRFVNYMAAAVNSNVIAVNFTPVSAPFNVVTADEKSKYADNLKLYNDYVNGQTAEDDIKENPVYKREQQAKKLTKMFASDWERLQMDYIKLEGTKDTLLSGDWVLYAYWDCDAQTGQDNKGMLEVESIDNVNYYPGNPNEADPQKQPYIILKRRELVANVKAEAKANGVKESDINNISADTDTEDVAGDAGKKELEETELSGKCSTLLYLWKDAKTKTIKAKKAAKNVIIRDEWDTKLKRYPVCVFSWDLRKNSCHGRSPLTGLIPNQVYINKQAALYQLDALNNVGGKVIYDKTRIEKWTNGVGTAIPCTGGTNDVITQVQGLPLPSNSLNFIQMCMDNTLQTLGMNDVTLGNVTPDNKSAYMAILEASSIPIECVKTRMRKMIEDFALIYIDILRANMTEPRWVEVNDDNGKPYYEVFGAEDFDSIVNVKIDVGASTLWSKIAAAQTADNLLHAGLIEMTDYLEMLPDDYLPNKNKLLQKYKEQQLQAQKQKEMLEQLQTQKAHQAQAQQAPAQNETPVQEQQIPTQTPQEQSPQMP